MPDLRNLGKDHGRGLTRSVMKFDKIFEIAFVLPAAVFVGWLIGAGLDRWLHQHWIYLVGIAFGIAAGFVQLFRLLAELEKEISTGKAAKTGSGDKKSAGDDKIQ